MQLRAIIIYIFGITSFINTQGQAPKYSNEFLNIGVGAKALGMGKSNTATVNDATANFWNPAGLLSLQNDIDLNAMHSEYFAGLMKYDYLGGGIKLDSSSAAGFSIVRLGVDGIQNTLELIDDQGNWDYNRIKYFSVADWAFLFSYAKQSRIPGLQYGANIKIIRRVMGEFANAWGFGFDVGIQYKTGNWQFGATGRDITSTFHAWNFNEDKLEATFAATGNEMPKKSLELTLPKLIIGAARSITFTEDISGMVEIDLDVYFDGKRNELIRTSFSSISPHAGFEVGYKDYVFIRGGFGNMQYINDFDNHFYSIEPSLGIGVEFENITIDYALSNIGNQGVSFYSNVFSLGYAFATK